MARFKTAADVKVGVVGYGGAFNMVRGHLNEMKKAGMTPVCIAEIDESRLAVAEKDFPGIQTYNSVEKMLKEHRDKVAEADAKEIDEALADAKKAMSEGGIERINAATDRLTRASHKLAEAMYKAAPQQPGGATPGAGPGGQQDKPEEKDNVVDAEFVDVDDKKK